MEHFFGYLALAALCAAAVFSSFPLWRSATLSPDAIQRRVWWTCCAVATVSLFLSQVPEWGRAFFVSVMAGMTLVAIAGFRTNFLKINGRIYAAFHLNRRPDRPPALHAGDESE